MKFKGLLSIFGILFFACLFVSSSGGRNGRYANAPGDSGFCGNCHTVTPGPGDISVSGSPGIYTPGATYPLTLTLTNGTAAVGGFQIVANDAVVNGQIGSFSTPAGTKLNNVSRLVQSTPKAFSGGSVSWDFDWIAPVTGPPIEVNFYFAGNAANGNGNRNGDMSYSGFVGDVFLPLELSAFEVMEKDEKIKIYWETIFEENISRFEIQRSSNTRSNFTSLGEVIPSNENFRTNTYQFFDSNFLNGAIHYYRLKIWEEDGSFSYSGIKNVRTSQDKKSLIYPNPLAKGQSLNFAYESKMEQEINIAVFDLQNKNYLNQTVQLNRGSNLIELKSIQNLEQGIYSIQIMNEHLEIETKKLLVH